MNSNPHSLREQISHTLEHLDHVLPGQGPILDFVHHNTLHGFQHLPFDEALAAFKALTGTDGYLPEAQFRAFYQQGRITGQDLSAALASRPDLQAEQIVCVANDKTITRGDIYRIAMLFDLPVLSVSQLNWQIEALCALTKPQADVPKSIRNADKQGIKKLWEGLLNKLDLENAALHPEELLDGTLEQTEDWFAEARTDASTHPDMQQQAQATLEHYLTALGESITLRGLVLALTGIDSLDFVRPQLIRLCASMLDQGVAAWSLPARSELGFYGAWRATARFDANPFLHELPDWQEIIAELPEDAIDAIILQLTHLGVPQAKWPGYLERLALELPGWSGMINWRQHHPHYHADPHTGSNTAPTLSDYLAIRLTLDRLWLNQICRNTWKIEAKLSAIRNYFAKNLSELLVRNVLYQGTLPEYLAHMAESLTMHAGSERQDRLDWQQLADLIWVWQLSGLAAGNQALTAGNSGWRLYRCCQHLGLSAEHLAALTQQDLLDCLTVLDDFNAEQRSKLWLIAYEHNYRQALFQALHSNRGRGRWAKREQRPEAQLIFCMDDREEGFRRHLEEHNPAIETWGAAGFFGVAMDYQGLDDNQASALCPIVVTPAHQVNEEVRPGHQSSQDKHEHGRQKVLKITNLLHHGIRRNLLSSHLLIDAIAPFTLPGLLVKALAPRIPHWLLTGLNRWLVPDVETKLSFSNDQPSSKQAKPGFSDAEQADRVAGFLRNTGLTYGFAQLVVLVGHGSISQNNPHLAAYDCGACSGRHGGPNARVFAAMANRPKIRRLVAERGISIPQDTWFIGAEHNTCDETIAWYDLADLPEARLTAFKKCQQELQHAQYLSAHERCRRLASAPRRPTTQEALRHIEERAIDFSQARPELGHATNASAVVGRRSLTQGAFFDRRVFLISYDPTQDPEGRTLEGILLAVGPVGAGINLEYYFSSVNNERFGCGTKVPHNVTGFFAVMEGASSDLRTGLPRQMIEIHEAMRLQLMVEAKTSVLGAIHARQPALRELIDGGWLHLSSIDPDSGEIFTFTPGTGFATWQALGEHLPTYDNSPACYGEQTLPVAPALIRQPDLLEA